MLNFYLFLAAFGTVFFPEILGDKTLFTIGALATRFRPLPVFCGIVLAFMANMFAAVLLGNAIANLPARLVAAVSSATFLATAVLIWFKRTEEDSHAETTACRVWSKGLFTGFAAIFFCEWADAGQISAAMLASQYQAPLVIWFGATLALVTKGILAVTLGVGLRRHLPRRVLHCGALTLCLTMSVLAALRL